MIKKKLISALCTLGVISAVFAVAVVFENCKSDSYKDGEWAGRSSEDDTGAWGEIAITIEQGRVGACVFITRQKDGTIKADDYGKINGEISNADFYEKAQLAVRAMKRYAEQYAASGSLDKVDGISGATIAYNQFMEAAEQALSAAKR